MTLVSKATRYNPYAELRANYPSWWFTTADFSGRQFDHMISWAEKTFVVDPGKFCGDKEWAFAHAAAHLDEHFDRLSALTVEDCEVADLIAKIRLDRECDRLPDCGGQTQMKMTYPLEDFPVDGDPTAPLDPFE